MTARVTPSRSRLHFERLYRDDPDPWRFETSPYERDKYAATLAALGARRFRAGFEVGCSIGVLTQALAGICDEVLGVDIVASAAEAARVRCAGCPGVTIETMEIPRQWPKGRFDLIVFSEVLYFLAAPDLRRAAAHTLRTIDPGGVVLLVNYTGPIDDPCTGDEAAARFIASVAPQLQPVVQRREPLYRLDVLTA